MKKETVLKNDAEFPKKRSSPPHQHFRRNERKFALFFSLTGSWSTLQYCGVLAPTAVTLREFLTSCQALFAPQHFDFHRVAVARLLLMINSS